MSIHISAELSHICPLEEITKHVEILETRGFHRVWVPDTVVSPWEAWIAASLIMQQTSRVRIGLGVMNPYTRHPVVVAQMAATMQNISGGRLSISLGKGIARFLEKAGIQQHMTAVEECASALRGLVSGERTSIDGEAFKIDGMKLRTNPPDAAVPIYLAAARSPGWEAALRFADGIATFWSDGLMDMRKKHMTGRTLPVAVLIPFAQSRKDFFPGLVASLDELKQRVASLEQGGFDEVIVAYGDKTDLETAAQLIQ